MDIVRMNAELITEVANEACRKVCEVIGTDLKECRLYGSCARGDFNEDSDIDIALIMECDRLGAKRYNSQLADIAAELAVKYFAIVNFVCLPFDEYEEKKEWYPYFMNIEKEGAILYG